jgi:hypothetical protein
LSEPFELATVLQAWKTCSFISINIYLWCFCLMYLR